MSLFNNFIDFLEGMANDTLEFLKDVEKSAIETKRDIISIWKDEVPFVGNTMEKTDRLFTTIKNVAEHLPDTPYKPFDPNYQLSKAIQNIVQTIINTVKESEIDLNLGIAQHLKVNRIGYSHHALSISDEYVIHYQDSEVKIESIEIFAKGGTIQVIDTTHLYSKDEVLARAYSRLGENEYNLLFNNCEHFVLWALKGA